MNAVSLRACAKINLYLRLTGKREDGYHTLESVMQTVGLYDTVLMKKNDTGKITLSMPGSDLPTDENNIAYRAAKAYLNAAGLSEGLALTIEKRIPCGAGLGGGSADAAAVLRGCQLLFDQALSEERLVSMARSLGSDVPFCLFGGTALVTGTGETVMPLSPMPRVCITLVTPSFRVETAAAYVALDDACGGDFSASKDVPACADMCQALDRGDLTGVTSRLYDQFAPVITAAHPELAEINRTLRHYDCEGVSMSGSGPATFGIYTAKRWDMAERACAAVRARRVPAVITEPVSSAYALFYSDPEE